jgi:hypothetical protein
VAFLHYGPDKSFELDDETIQAVLTTANSFIERGGGIIEFTDISGHEWSILVSAGIPLWADARLGPSPYL